MSRYGLSTFSSPDDAKFDIVFVHGLRGNREKTWTKGGILWPRDLLAPELPDSRIMSFGYDSAIIHSDTTEVTQGSLTNVARSLCGSLTTVRSTPETANRPILLVAHSLGGLGIVLLGTPFGGSVLAKWGDLIRKVFETVQKTDAGTLKSLKLDSQELKDLEKIKVVFFYEELDTYKIRVVEQSSAAYFGLGEILPLRANHTEICMINSEDDPGYGLVKAKILELLHYNGKSKPPVRSGGNTNNYYGKILNNVTGVQHIGTQNVNF
ncbi:uncharacterized protein N7483_008005 [Penicillium malachiteum]|uniref:uncharacterized protein n=1 Tax=Penicillium malachiteum TaxID=1324776 RepID=UPI002546899A|nr:uncharacterized protein N7483_008005 [Penicillium malachiteum]KAJ5726648.1 hypothetical protein N7483_008005 [Penicillium malachiteum]